MPKFGQIKAGKGTLIGNAGEYFVVGELLRRGIVAALAPRNAPGFDVLAVDGDASANIRVKSKTDAAGMWRWNAKEDGSIFRTITDNDFTVLVDLKDSREPPEFFVLKTRDLDSALKRDFDQWKNTPGRGGRLRDASNPIRGLGDWGDHYPAMLKEARQNWELITAWLSANTTMPEIGVDMSIGDEDAIEVDA